jgi:DNA/RNA-binding domain of Phe-tRNA-synthetase-like protein
MREGWVAPEVRAEFPQLALISVSMTAHWQLIQPQPIRAHLRVLADRWRGARAAKLRGEPVPAAYRAFFRQTGLDPDLTPTAIEQVIFARLMRGGFSSQGPLQDALQIALIETGVPVWALDTERLNGALGIRLGDPVQSLAGSLPAGEDQLIVADEARALSGLFDSVPAPYRATTGTRQLTLFCIQVAGVPSLYVEEALWMCVSIVGGGEQDAFS